MNEEAIPVIFSCDDKFVPHAACTIASIVKNSDRRYQFYLLDCGISEHNKQKLAAWDLGGNTLTVMPMQKLEVFEGIPLPSYLSQATLYRHRIPDLFPELTKAIYLDSDVVVVGDLGKLWDIDLSNRLIGIVYEDPFYSKQDLTRDKLRVGISPEKSYFNNGVMLMNLVALRQAKFLHQLITYFQKHASTRLIGQDVQNILLDPTQVLELAPEFNGLVAAPYARRCLLGHDWVCLHFNGPKPWHLYGWFVKVWPSFFCRCCRYYHEYLELTPWANEVRTALKPYKFIKQTLHLSREWLQHKLSYFEERLFTR